RAARILTNALRGRPDTAGDGRRWGELGDMGMSTWLGSPDTDALGGPLLGFLDELPVGMFVVDLAGTPLYCNAMAMKLIGDGIDITSPEVMHPDDLQSVIDAFARARAEHRTDVEFRAHHRDGTWRWLEFVVTDLTDDPSVNGFVINGRDVTDRKEAETAVRI